MDVNDVNLVEDYQMKDTKDKLAVLVVSCDNYSDLWGPFFQLFWHFWPDCPFNVYLLSNLKGADIPKVQNLRIGADISWSDNLLNGLNQLKEEYILMFIDDLFLVDFVRSDKVTEIFNWALQSNANYIRLNPSIRPDKPYNNLIGLVSKGTIYRTATVISIWKKSVLLELLKSGESAWEFEIYGAVRSDRYEGFYSTWEDHLPIINGVIKGKWQRVAVKKLKSLGVTIDIGKRKIMTLNETLNLSLLIARSKLLNRFPARHRRKIKDFVLGGKYDYKVCVK